MRCARASAMASRGVRRASCQSRSCSRAAVAAAVAEKQLRAMTAAEGPGSAAAAPGSGNSSSPHKTNTTSSSLRSATSASSSTSSPFSVRMHLAPEGSFSFLVAFSRSSASESGTAMSLPRGSAHAANADPLRHDASRPAPLLFFFVRQPPSALTTEWVLGRPGGAQTTPDRALTIFAFPGPGPHKG